MGGSGVPPTSGPPAGPPTQGPPGNWVTMGLAPQAQGIENQYLGMQQPNDMHSIVLLALKNLVGHSASQPESGDEHQLGMEAEDAELLPESDDTTPIPPQERRSPQGKT